jgi:stage II sporulation protein D
MKIKITAFTLIFISNFIFFVAPSSAATHYINFSGRGWGHGIGLSQYGAKGYADHGFSADKILRHYYTGSQKGTVSNSTVRVHIAASRSFINLTSASQYYLVDLSTKKRYTLKKSSNYRVYKYGTRYKLYNVSSRKTERICKGPLYFREGRSPLMLLNSNDNGRKKIKYRGSLKVVLRGSIFNVINYIKLESYLRGVISSEMPSSWHIEALKAQAVAARSYAVASKKNRGDFDLYSTVLSQVYGGYSAETSRTNSACKATSGVVQTYNGRVIMAFFFSSSGGKTENNENIWGSSKVPYLRGVESPYEDTCIWPGGAVKLSLGSLASKLGTYSSSNRTGVIGSLVNLTVVKTGFSPRVIQVKITGSKGESYISGTKLQKLLKLKSTWFSISKS